MGAAPALRSLSNPFFEVVGLDQRSVSYTEELSGFTAQIAARYLDAESMAFPVPILVSLRPEAHVNFVGDYRISVAVRGGVRLDILWEDSLTLERTCRALSEALLLQYALYNYGPEAAGKVRAWPVTALAAEVYIGLRPAKFIDLVNRTRAVDLLPISFVLEASQGDPFADSAFGYWMLQVLKSGHMDRLLVRSLFQQAVAGVDIEDALVLAIQPLDPDADALPAEIWWEVQLFNLLSREYEVIESMDSSRDWLEPLVKLDMAVELESGTVQVNLRSMWKYRDQPQVRELVEARYEILRLRMTRINPAFFNPARSLGVLYEALLSEEPSYKYVHALVLFLSDWEDAREMQAEIEEILE